MIRLSVGHDKTVYPWHGGRAWHGCQWGMTKLSTLGTGAGHGMAAIL